MTEEPLGIDWNKTTFEGSRAEQLRETGAMTVRQRLEALDQLAKLSQRLRVMPRSGHGSTTPEQAEP